MKRIEIGIGLGFTGSGIPISPANRRYMKRAILALASVTFGGANWIRGTGVWNDPSRNNLPITEHSAVLMIYADSDKVKFAVPFAKQIREICQQQAVLLSVSPVESTLI